MGYLKQIDEDQASGVVRRVYDAAVARAEYVASVIKVMSLDARALQASVNLYTTLMKSKSALDPTQREMLATVVSNANNCFYCTLSHGEDYKNETGNKKRAESLIFDYRKAGLDEKELALCEYAVKLTLSPGEMTEDDVDTVKSAGFNDEQVVVATQIIGYFNYLNRIANALGAEDEIWMNMDPEEWAKKKAKDLLAKKKK